MKNRKLLNWIMVIPCVAVLTLIACKTGSKMAGTNNQALNTLTKKEVKEGWKLLFDGKSFKGWRGLGRDHVPVGYWVIENGVIRKLSTEQAKAAAVNQTPETGDLMTEETFDNFELSFEWKINKGGNSGLKYNVSEDMCRENNSKYSALGFEYQLLDDSDDAYKGVLKPSQFTGSLYDLIPSSNVNLKPVGEFNSSRIIVNGNHAEHWLNGNKVVEYDFGSDILDRAYKESKFSKIAGFTDKRKGHIVLQNHNDESWFRNIKIRELKK